MACQKCGGERVMQAGAKCSDLFFGSMTGVEVDGYVPRDIGIGGGDYVEFAYCLDCGQMQGKWPLPLSKMEA